MTALEYLNNAADPWSCELLWTALHAQRWIEVITESMTRALEVHHEMAVLSALPLADARSTSLTQYSWPEAAAGQPVSRLVVSK